uniref:ATP-binding protein n=1 Tax=Candidatus Igneacidithiobacillus taiwanensis TaxID=1945924 RepID=UPI00289D922D
MRLLELGIRSFKGVASLDLPLGGRDATIYGANATGKTTVVDAYLWLLFGRDSANRADFAVKTLDPTGNAIPNLDHEVRAVISLDDGRTVTLK